jgi:tail fiber protein gp32
MTIDVSGFGSLINIVATNTFPAGFVVTQFSDDADAFDVEAIDIAAGTMGVNGDLIKAAKASPLPFTVAVIPGGADDVNLSILFEANRVGQGKFSAQDIINATIIYPNGTTRILSGGFCLNFMPGISVAGSGRQKTKPFKFMFAQSTGTFTQ